MRPLVSVITSVFNGERYADRAVPSILGQTFCDFEYIIVDDGSTDSTAELLQKFAAEDKRVRVLSAGRLGRSKALNYAVENAKGEYIANQDFDDISYPTRLEKQVLLLNANPMVGVVGSYFIQIDEGTRRSILHPPTHHQDIVRTLAKSITICHTLATFRKAAWSQAGGYPDMVAQDFRLWISLARQGWELAIVPEVLGEHNEHEQSFFHSAINRRWRQKNMAYLQWQAIRELHLPLWMAIYPIGRVIAACMPFAIWRRLRAKLGGFAAR